LTYITRRMIMTMVTMVMTMVLRDVRFVWSYIVVVLMCRNDINMWLCFHFEFWMLNGCINQWHVTLYFVERLY
jgi:hypothetical protein